LESVSEEEQESCGVFSQSRLLGRPGYGPRLQLKISILFDSLIRKEDCTYIFELIIVISVAPVKVQDIISKNRDVQLGKHDAIMSSSNNLPPVEKLKGIDNYNDWKFAMQQYLEHENLWGCVIGDATAMQNSRNMAKAKAKLVLSVDKVNYIHIRDAITSKEVG